MKQYHARVRGIYCTALTKMLLDMNFKIVQASEIIQDRLELNEEIDFYDIDIKDRDDRQGIKVTGLMEPLNIFIKNLREYMLDIIIRRWPIPIDGIYVGKVTDIHQHILYIDIGETIGTLKIEKTDKYSIGEKILVQINRESAGRKHPYLLKEIRIPGKYVILIDKPGVKISRKIVDKNCREKLYNLGRKLVKDNIGLIWRSSSKNKDEEILIEEYNSLKELYYKIISNAEEENTPKMIWGSQYFIDIEFPYLSKIFLDNIRSKVAPTIKNHHRFRASGPIISKYVDMAERLLERGDKPENVYKKFLNTIDKYYFCEGDYIKIYHVKPDGKVIVMGPAKVIKMSWDRSKIYVERRIMGRGVYDGLDIEKEEGDYAITVFEEGKWSYETRYYNRENKLKGIYININTPIEVYPFGIRYIDLEVDVTIDKDGIKKVHDLSLFKNAIEMGFLNPKIEERVLNLIMEVENKQFQLD